jgi:hypothetical protein
MNAEGGGGHEPAVVIAAGDTPLPIEKGEHGDLRGEG